MWIGQSRHNFLSVIFKIIQIIAVFLCRIAMLNLGLS